MDWDKCFFSFIQQSWPFFQVTSVSTTSGLLFGTFTWDISYIVKGIQEEEQNSATHDNAEEDDTLERRKRVPSESESVANGGNEDRKQTDSRLTEQVVEKTPKELEALMPDKNGYSHYIIVVCSFSYTVQYPLPFTIEISSSVG